ncbi:MAG: apolipoprotein N-acyltransferase [Desulfuromonadaceae bacterium]|nr:apolipoprotein N-acyltransferase [Desulfuromonadaceae bacterium]MDD2848756.1 apolipoprotein N-acyltransferase [Desulfuromonadaceae bacterium]MDD4130406.1 apolipoprotein N-acyltransferase [Desulfuromonadaceae bacterium]
MIPLISVSLFRQIFDRRGWLAITSGILIALSFPNAGLSFLAWIALIPLLIAMEASSPKEAFRVGLTCGISAYAIILYWLNIVFTHYGHLPWVVSIPVYLLLVLWLALFYALSTFIARMGELSGIKAAFTLPVAWVAFDFIRSFLFSGFAWGMLGHSQFRILPLIQIADLAGVYGITLLIVLANTVLHRALRAVSGVGVPYPVKSAAVILLLLIGTLFYGFNRLNEPENSNSKPLRVALIQGNISQDVKWSIDFREQTIDTYVRLTREASKDGVDLIVWPESAVPFFFQDEPLQAERIRNLARETSACILFGSPAHELRNGRSTLLNSAFMVSPSGETIGRADKMHLVPFGEYVPMGNILTFINKLVVGIGDFAPGEHAVILDTGSTKLGVQVCYEVIFPELARQYVQAGARVLVAITNDAWFGRSSAPYQHLAIATFRAIETRTPLIRAANTGVTAIVDQNGHISTMTGLFVEAFRTGEIQPGSGKSLYLTIGDTPAWLCVLLTAGVVLLIVIRRKKNNL